MRMFLVGSLLVFAALQPQSFSGTLEATDPLWEGSRHYDAYPVDVELQQQVTVRMTSQEFDTFLIVRSPGGLELTNDDFEGTSVSQLDFIATEAGEWSVMASGFGSESFGAYSLEVTLGGIGQVETISGRLDPSDAEAIKGEYYDTHMIDVTDDGPFTLELMAYGFDGFLVAKSPGGETWRNDDADSAEQSRIGPLSGVGTWTVHVTTSYPGGVGAYDLKVIRFPQ